MPCARAETFKHPPWVCLYFKAKPPENVYVFSISSSNITNKT